MRWSALPALAAGCLLAALPPLFGQASLPADQVTQQSLTFTRLYQTLEQHYMAPLDPDHLILEGAIRGMLSSLDPFSSFFDQGQFKLLQQETRGEAIGFGSILYVQPGKVTVIQTQQGSPSWRAGLGPGDQIVALNGVLVKRLDFRSLIRALEQARAHPVHLGVLRPGETAPVDISMKPAEVKLPTVDIAFDYSSTMGYIHVTSFESKTPQEVVKALTDLQVQHLQGLVLDLRNNPGGVLSSAVTVCSLFMKRNTIVLTVEGRALPKKTYRTIATPLQVSIPLIVLVNGNTASAAEVVAAALQDHDRALIVGEPTFGKGVVETVMPLSDEMGLALITAEYFTPSGRSIQKPLAGTALENLTRGISTPDSDLPSHGALVFHTDDGRPVSAHGGVTPDVRAPARPLDPWLMFLDQTGMFASFASQYISYHTKLDKSFEPSSETLQEFRNFLTGQRIRSPAEYWNNDQHYLKTHIKIALFNLAFGLDYGNQVATRDDPQVEKAVSLFDEIPALLKGPQPLGAYTAAKR